MYRVTIFDGPEDKAGTEIHSPYVDDLKISSNSLKLTINAIGSFTFTIYRNNPGYNKVKPLKTLVNVVDTKSKKIIFEGRVFAPTETMTSSGEISKEFICEDELGYLHDSVMSDMEINNKTPRQLLEIILNMHNAQVEDYKKFYVGVTEVTNNTDNVRRVISSEKSAFDTIMEKLINNELLGGELEIRKENGKRYLDWKKQVGKKSTTKIQIAKNLLEMSKQIDSSGIITALFPRGARLERKADEQPADSKEEPWQPRLTIKDVNGGKEYLMASKEMLMEFGFQGKPKVWEDVTVADNLLRKGKEFLANQFAAIGKYRIKAVDLSVLNIDTERFWKGNTCRVYNPLMNTDENLRIAGMNININEPAMSDMDFGDKNLTMSQYQTEILKSKSLDDSKLDYLTAELNASNDKLSKLNANYIAVKNKTDLIDELENRIKELEKQLDNGSPVDPSKPVGKIIDVSEWQGVIDWDAAKADGVELAIIRVQHGSNYQDMKYAENIFKVKKAGLKYAVYAYAGYVSDGDAQIEAQDFYDRTQKAVGIGEKPLFYMIDIEEQSATDMRTATQAWCAKMTALGVPSINQVAYIANNLYDSFNIDVAKFGSIIVPSYGVNDGTISSSIRPTHPYDLWQYTSAGSVVGIKGNVDMNTEASTRFKKQYLGRG